MYIDPFVAGVLSTILVEMVILIFVAIYIAGGKR